MVHYGQDTILSRIGGVSATLPFSLEFKQIKLSQGSQHITFDKPFTTAPTVVGTFTQSKNTFKKVSFSPFSLALSKLSLGGITLDGFEIDRAPQLTVPSIPNLTPPTANDITPWGTGWAQTLNANCDSIPVLGVICGGLGVLLTFVGNAFFYAYYSSTGDWSVITKSIMGRVYSDMTSLINNHITTILNPILDEIENGVNQRLTDITNGVNGAISNTERAINTQIANTEAALDEALSGLATDFSTIVNLVPGIIMSAIGYSPDQNGNYNLPIPVNVTNISSTGFDVDVPQAGLILNYAALAV